jgi:hypothetical protein
VNQFIEECRREWKRLRVPDPVANEMAADLAADLTEAESEGASPEEVIGSGAFDPRSFAASWAAARGVIPPRPVSDGISRRPAVLATVVAFAVIAVVGAALLILARPSGATQVRLAAPFPPAVVRVRPAQLGPAYPLPRPLLRVGPARVFAFPADDVGHAELRPIGSILVITGILGMIIAVLYWTMWVDHRRWSRHRTYIDEGPGGADYD